LNRLRLFNTALSGIVLVFGLYIILLPVLPNAQFWLKRHTQAPPRLVQQNTHPSFTPGPHEDIPTQNTLVVPAMDLQEPINEGLTAAALAKGVWHRPRTSNPTQASNTVLVGHRFTYTNPQGVFYHLDKVKVGDPLVLYWEGDKYVYKVERVFVVPPTAAEIEQPTVRPTLTLYTCTPLWSAHDRLVVQAILEGY
jgi:LPXTG-site transpeptidase (sortase) family protein